MPLFQIGYRRYEGKRVAKSMHWWPITRTGLAIAWRSKLLRRLVYSSFLPFLYFGVIFFVIGRITDPSMDTAGPFFQLARNLFGADLVEQLHQNPALIRSAIWSMVFGTFGTLIQLMMAALVAAIVGPPLVATDLRTRAFLIYFSRPLSRMDYIIGKAGILVGVISLVTLVPSLVLYLLSILFSPSIGTFVQTFPVLISIILANLITIVPAALIMLTISSLTKQPRFATIGWFLINLFGLVAHVALENTRGLRDNGWSFLLSLGHTFRAVQLGIYNVEGRSEDLALGRDVRALIHELSPDNSPLKAAIWLSLLCCGCLVILHRRVDSPTRI